MNIDQRIKKSIICALEGFFPEYDKSLAAEMITDYIKDGLIDGVMIDPREFTRVDKGEFDTYCKQHNLKDARPGCIGSASEYSDHNGNILARCYYEQGILHYVKK